MAAFCADRLLRVMISSSGEGRLGSLNTQRATRETLLSCLTVSCFNVITCPALVHEAFSGGDPTNIHLAARVTPQSSAQTCAESHLKSCAHQHLTDVCVAVFDVHAAPSSVQMTDLSETKVRLLVHETTPACMLNLHLYKFGASGWDVLFHFPGATPQTKSQELAIRGVSHVVWPSSS